MIIAENDRNAYASAESDRRGFWWRAEQYGDGSDFCEWGGQTSQAAIPDLIGILNAVAALVSAGYMHCPLVIRCGSQQAIAALIQPKIQSPSVIPIVEAILLLASKFASVSFRHETGALA